MFAGLGAARIRRLFAIAKKHRPAIIFIDELDAIGLSRGFDLSREKDQTLNQLLVEMDGFEDRGDLIVIAASNRLDGLDTALLRPGRFDRQVLVGAPDLRGREQILRVHTRTKPVQEVDLEMVARRTVGLTGADLANLCNEAAIYAGRESRDCIKQADFDGALERVVAGLQTRRVITPSEKQVIAYHEAGHALVSELLPAVSTLHKISIVPRGRALGYTLNLPEEDRYLMSKEDLLDHMSMLLGGFVTEQLIFGRTTTGASDDLKRVAEVSRSMIREYGMGSKLLAHLNASMAEDGASQATLQRLDEEQQLLIDDALFTARTVISDNRDLLDRIAKELIAKESLERDEITAVVNEVNAARSGVRPPAEAVDPVIVGLPAIGDSPEQEAATVDSGDPDLKRHVVVPPERRLRSVAPPGTEGSQSVPPPVNGNGRAHHQAAEPV
jgi:cell division protease FtsH